MQHKNLIYILIFLTAAFLGFTGLLTWQDKPSKEEITDVKTLPGKANAKNKIAETTAKPTIAKATKYDVPVLMYHYVRIAPEGDSLGQSLSVTPENFALQMAWLKQENYASIEVSDLADPEKREISRILSQGKKPIAITFDDGYDDAYTAAYPVMQKEGFIGTFYIIRNYVGRAGYMNETQINELAFVGNEIGSHSLSHPSLEKASEDRQYKEIFESKMLANAFCYPSGKYNETTVNLLKQAGYTTAVTTKPGIVNQDSNLFELRRVRVKDGDGEMLKYYIEKAFNL